MRHECKDADDYNAFVDLVQDGVIEYDDWFNAYTWNRIAKQEPLWRKIGRKLGLWSTYYTTKTISAMDIMSFCPYCGEKINYSQDTKGEGTPCKQ
jgi:hypothetical protein